MVVDTVAALRRATDAAWRWFKVHMELLGSGLARLLSHDQLLGTSGPAESRTLLLALRVDTAAEAVMTILPLGRGTGVAAYGGFGGHNGMDRFGGTVWGFGTGMSNGGGAPGGTLGVGGFKFDDASPQFPAMSDIPRGDSAIASPSLAAATGWLEVVRVGGPGGHRSAAGDFLGVDELPGLFPSFRISGGASDASCAPGAVVTATSTGDAGVYASRYT